MIFSRVLNIFAMLSPLLYQRAGLPGGPGPETVLSEELNLSEESSSSEVRRSLHVLLGFEL